MMRIPINEGRALTRFVYYWLRTARVRTCLEHAGSGTSSTMKKITQQDVMSLPFPTGASVALQQIAVEKLDTIVGRVEELRSVQRSADQDLTSLMPALLDRALHGEILTTAV